jgi:branched-chain amino acid transport system permease protein
MRWIGMGVLLAALLAFPLVFPNPAVTSIGVFTMIFLIAACAWNIFSGFSGYISIGHAAFYGIGQYTVALLALHYKIAAGWDTFALLPVAGLVAALAAVPVGYVLLRVRRHAFIILSVAVFFILQLLAFNLTGLTSGSSGLTLPFPSWQGASFNDPFYYVGLAVALAAFGTAWWVRHSKYGLALLAIRDDEDRALGLGVHVTSTKLSAYMLSALFVGVAGGLYVPFVGSVYPQFAFDPTFDLASTVMVFVGGIGTLAGPVVGVLLLEPLQQYLELQFGAQNLFLIIYAALFIVILRLLPGGIVPGIADRWRRWMTARVARSTSGRDSPPPPAMEPHRAPASAAAPATGLKDKP